MAHRRHCRVRYFAYWVLMLGSYGVSSVNSGQAACYRTPRAAIDSVKRGSSIAPISGDGGYRVMSIQSDIVLRHRWAWIASCNHPEWPASAVQIAEPRSESLPSLQTQQTSLSNSRAVPMVRAGDLVLLWKQEDLLRIEIAGVSEESGGLGNTIRVRLLHRNTDDQAMQEQFSGIVRGPSDVEMQP
jgi:hypothetical protein